MNDDKKVSACRYEKETAMHANNGVGVNRNYKDSLFRLLFGKNKENGSDRQMDDADRIELKLSDAFEQPDGKETHGFEWTATMLNINAGRNKALMEKCCVLAGYSTFTGKVKEYSKTMELREAIDAAVEECIREDVLRDVLEKHRREVVDMCLTEFDERKYGEIVREEGYEAGCIEGLKRGRAQGIELGVERNAREVYRRCLARGMSKEEALIVSGVSEDAIKRGL